MEVMSELASILGERKGLAAAASANPSLGSNRTLDLNQRPPARTCGSQPIREGGCRRRPAALAQAR